MVLRLRNRSTGKLQEVGKLSRSGGGFTFGVINSKVAAEANRNISPVVQPPRPNTSTAQLQAQTTNVNPNLFNPLLMPATNVLVTPITQQTNRSLKYKAANAYKAIDNALLGVLPGGNSPTYVNTQRTIRKTAEQKANFDAKLAAQKQEQDFKIQQLQNDVKFAADKSTSKEQIDLVTQSWYEKFGLFTSENERAIQNLLDRQAFFEQQAITIPATAEAFLQAQSAASNNPAILDAVNTQIGSQDKGFFGNLGSTVGLGLLALGALFVLKD
jgi:hypothetical protein